MTDRHASPLVREVLEQYDAAVGTIGRHRCFHCGLASAVHPVMIIEDTPGGCRVVVLGVCDTCAHDVGGKRDNGNR